MTRLVFLALAGLLLSGAARAADDMTMHHGPGLAAAPPAEASTPADKAFAASNGAMMQGMDVKLSGDPDRDFVAMMLPHHQGAIDMAKVELQYGKDPMLRKLAADVVKAQAAEIARMQAWRDRHPQ